MFWNLHESAWSMRAGDDKQWRQQVEIIRRHSPDVLAVTEGWDWHLDGEALYKKALADFGYSAGTLYEAKTSCDMAVMWRDGIRLAGIETQPHKLAPWHGWLRVALELPGSAQPFTVMISHLNPFDPTLRRTEGSFLRVWMQQTEKGILVMDANSVAPGDPEPGPDPSRNFPGSAVGDRVPLETLDEAGLVDIGARFDDRRPTFGYYQSEKQSSAPPVRIDQAWATPSVEVVDYQVLDSTVDDPGIDVASDHRPILITIRP